MATSVYFNNFASSQEQLLIENLIVESIKIYGHDVYYLPRRIRNKDEIFGEDVASFYNAAYFIEMYIKSVDGFAGDGELFTKFNLEIRDRVTFTVTRRVFAEEVLTSENFNRPREGDLIFFPLNNKLFQIKFVEHESMFYQLGALQTYDLECELFEYSNEKLITGIPEIDQIETTFKTSVEGVFIDIDNNVVSNIDLSSSSAISDNEIIQQGSDGFIDFSEVDPFSEGKI